MRGLSAAMPSRTSGVSTGPSVRPTSASWLDSDGLAAALHRNRDSELADIFAAPGAPHVHAHLFTGHCGSV